MPDPACPAPKQGMPVIREQQLVLVLGMHRSGTSAWVRALQVLGFDLGEDLLPPHPCNPKGFFEDGHIYAFNKALLADTGRRWHSIPIPAAEELLPLAGGVRGAQALELLRHKLAARPLLGLKDPRMSVLMPFWRPVLAAAGAHVHCLICLRHPDSVARSLQQRDGMSAEHSHALWLAHTLGAVTGSAGLQRTLVSYEALLRAPAQELRRLSTALCRSVNSKEETVYCSSFLDAGLYHHQAHEEREAAPAPPGSFARLAQNLHARLCPCNAPPPDLEQPEMTRLFRSLERRCADISPQDFAAATRQEQNP